MKKNLPHTLLLMLMLIMTQSIVAQNMGINDSGVQPNASAMLDVRSTSKGFLMPRMTAAQRAAITSPAHQLLVMQTNQSEGLYMYDSVNSNWLHLLDSAAIAAMIQSSATPSIDSVLAAGNDGGGDSLVNVNAMAIGGTVPNAQVQIDSFTVIEGSGYENAYGWFGFNTKKVDDTTLTYLHNGTPALMAAGDNFLGFFLWPNGTSGSTLPNDATAYIRVQENEIEMGNTTQIFQFGDHFEFNEGRMEVQSTGNSIIIGNNAGANDDFTNNSNILIGTNAGAATTTAIRTVAIGEGAMQTQTTQNNNIGIGYNAGNGLTGSGNIAIGSYALGSASGAGQSTAIGYTAAENATGSSNTVIGYAALKSNSTGANNVAVGVNAGENSSGSGNIFLGRRAGQNATGGNKLYIDNSNTNTPLIYGNLSSDSIRIYGSLAIKNEYTFPTTDGDSGQVMITDGLGNLTWSDPGFTVSGGDVYIDSGKVGIGTTSPIFNFHLAGSEGKKIETYNMGTATTIHNLPITDSTLVLRVTGSTAATDLTGMQAGEDGRIIYLLNATGQELIFKYNNAGSTAGNRFLCRDFNDKNFKELQITSFIYSTADGGWVMLSEH